MRKFSRKKKKTKNLGSNLYDLLKEKAEKSRDNSLPNWQVKVITHDDLFEAFMQNGIEYKGQLCSGYSSRGYGAKVESSVDLGSLVSPFVTIAISGSYQATRAQQMMIVMTRMPKSLMYFETKLPVVLSCMKGMKKTHAVTVSLEAGVQTPGIYTDMNSNDPGFQSPSLQEPGDKADLLSLELGAKATATLSGGWSGIWLKMRDLSPSYFKSINDDFLKSAVATMIGPGSKSKVKNDVLKFFDVHPKFTPYKPKRKAWKHVTGGNITFKRLEDSLNAVDKLLKTDPLFIKDYRRPKYINRLTYHKLQIFAFKEYDFDYFAKTRIKKMEIRYNELNAEEQIVRDQNLCFLDLVSHKPEAGASTQVSFGAGVLGQGISGKAETGIKGYIKTTSYRYQNHGLNENNGDIIIMTQDTSIRYKQVQIYAEIGVEGQLLHKSGGKSASKQKLLYNSFSYQSGVVFWAPPQRNSKFNKGGGVKSLMGSGVSFGESALPVTLIKHFRNYEKNKTDKGSKLYLSNLAGMLHVGLNELCDFIKACQNTLVKFATSYNSGNTSVIIESCFEQEGDKLEINMLEKGVPEIKGGKKTFITTMAKAVSKKVPQCIRLRARRADVIDDTKVKFKLGMGIPGSNTSFGIELLSVEEAGTEAVLDLRTHWFSPYHGYNQTVYNNPNNFVKSMAFDAAVPPVAIFHQ